MATQTEIDRDYRKLKLLLEATDSFVLTFALYRDAKEQRENAGKLKGMLELPITQVALKGDNLNPVRTFLDLPKEPRQAIFYTFLGSSLPEGKSDFDKFAGYVNIQREAFTDAPHAVVLWLREEQLVRLMRRAPDFWAWRSGVFDFRGELTEAPVTHRDSELPITYNRAPLEEQAALYREILKSQLQRDKPDLAYIVRTRLRLCKALNKLGLYQDMASEAREALSTAQTLENETLETEALNSLALAYRVLDNHDKAVLLHEKAVKLGGKVFGKEHEEYALLLCNLAGSLARVRRYDEAESLYKESIELAKKTFGEESPDYAAILYNYVRFLDDMARFDEAESLCQEAVSITAKNFGKKHPRYAASIVGLASLLAETERYDEAESLQRKAIEIFRETLGKEHPSYAVSLLHLANLLTELGRYEEAKPLFYEFHQTDYQRLKQELAAKRTVGETV